MATLSTTSSTSDTEGAQRHRLEPATLRLLADYELRSSPSVDEIAPEGEQARRLTGVAGLGRDPQPQDFDPTLAAHPLIADPVTNPRWWPRRYRRVPEYRPVNRELDLSERRQDTITTIVGTFMVVGCCTIANWAMLWRNTGGQLTDFGLTKIGGEF